MANLKTYLLNILAKKDFSTQELINKSLKKGFSQAEADEAVTHLEKQGFVSNLRLATNFVNYNFGKKGKIWIEQKLKQKLIPNEIIDQVLLELKENDDTEIYETSLDKLKQKVKSKYKIEDFGQIEFNLKQKVVAFLYRQGFDNALEIFDSWSRENF